MGIVEIAEATAPFTTPVSVVALMGALFVYTTTHKKERSVLAQIIGDAPLTGAETIEVLRTFHDDYHRLQALDKILRSRGYAGQATEVLKRANDQESTLLALHHRSRGRALAGVFTTGCFLLAFSGMGIAANACNGRTPLPACDDFTGKWIRRDDKFVLHMKTYPDCTTTVDTPEDPNFAHSMKAKAAGSVVTGVVRRVDRKTGCTVYLHERYTIEGSMLHSVLEGVEGQCGAMDQNYPENKWYDHDEETAASD